MSDYMVDSGILYKRHYSKEEALNAFYGGEEVVELIPLKDGSFAESLIESDKQITSVSHTEFASIVKDLRTRVIASPSFLWEIIEELEWEKDKDYKRIRVYLRNKYTDKSVEALRNFVEYKRKLLQTRFDNHWLESIPASDDSWWDLCAEVVGRGRQFYETINVEKLRKMAQLYDYTENFEYSFQKDV